MTLYKLPTLALISLALAAASCEAQDRRADSQSQHSPATQAGKATEEKRPVNYLPLSTRSRWEYDVTIDLPLGVQKQASAVTKVDGRVEIDGKTYFKVVMQVYGAPVNPTNVVYFRPTDKGLYQILEGEEKHGEWLFLPKELKVGQKWSASTPSSKFEFEVTDRCDLTCLGKTYKNCIALSVDMKSKFGSISQKQWLAPGVGLVKQFDDHTLFDSTAELKKYVGESKR